jgi:hypothetical protein
MAGDMNQIDVAFYASDGTTFRSTFPAPPAGTDPIEAIEQLLREKKRTGKLLECDSADINSGSGSRIFLVPSAVIGVIVQKSFDYSAVA